MRTVFHLTSFDTGKQSELLGNVKNLMDDSKVEVEEIAVVLNGDAVKMVEDGSEASDFLSDYLYDGVKVFACSNSIENRELQEIIEGVEKASSGVGKLTELQEEGFNYIRV